MKNIAILDTVYGDTGKGRVAHYFSTKFGWHIRFGGSSNCGHVIYRDGKKYNHHLLPSADYRNPHTRSFLASGMYIHLHTLLEEVKSATQDFPGAAKTIYVDPDAFVITDEHIKIDRETNKHLGTTGQGVGVAASAKYARTSSRIYNHINDNAEVIQELKTLGIHFTTLLTLREQFERSNLLFEGHQGVMLDINAGITPYTTSSDCTVAGIAAAGFNFIKLDRVYGLSKAGYLTKSGEGPLPSEIFGEEADRLRTLGGEVGNTTGRNRRIAYLDLPMLKYGIRKGGITHLILTKLDIMNGQDKIKVCYDYGTEIHSPNDFRHAKPYYVELLGWRDARDLKQIVPFIKHIEDFTNTPVEYVSVGVNDADMLDLRVKEETPQIQDRARLTNPFDNTSSFSLIPDGEILTNSNHLALTSEPPPHLTLTQVMTEMAERREHQ